MTGPFAEHLVSTDAVVGTQSQPRSKVCLRVPPAHVQPHLTDHRLGYQQVNAIDPRQIHPADPVEFAAQVKARRVALGSLAIPGRFGFLPLAPLPLIRGGFHLWNRQLRSSSSLMSLLSRQTS